MSSSKEGAGVLEASEEGDLMCRVQRKKSLQGFAYHTGKMLGREHSAVLLCRMAFPADFW